MFVAAFIGLAFRSLAVAPASLLAGIFPVLAAGALLRLLGQGLQFASVVALMVSFGLGLSATIHFLNRMWREDRRDRDPAIAVERATVLDRTGADPDDVGARLRSGGPRILGLPALRVFRLAQRLRDVGRARRRPPHSASGDHLSHEDSRRPLAQKGGLTKQQISANLLEAIMTMRSQSHCGFSRIAGLLLATGVAGAALLHPAAASARSASPFANFEGRWRGSGEVIAADGSRERIRCRASYEISENSGALTQSLLCASASYRVDVSSYVVANGQDAQGYWSERTRQVQGHLAGRIADGQFEGAVSGPSFTAQLSLRASGGRQTVDIRPQAPRRRGRSRAFTRKLTKAACVCGGGGARPWLLSTNATAAYALAERLARRRSGQVERAVRAVHRRSGAGAAIVRPA